jgi:hypothetical protein
VSYKLQRACAGKCRVRVQLRYRNGKVLFATLPKGSGRLLAASTVTLKTTKNKTKTFRVTIGRKALRGVKWKRAGQRFRVLPVRLLVDLPQADGRKLTTVRDGVLKLRVR